MDNVWEHMQSVYNGKICDLWYRCREEDHKVIEVKVAVKGIHVELMGNEITKFIRDADNFVKTQRMRQKFCPTCHDPSCGGCE